MTQYTRPDELVFASGAKPGELQSFPDIPRGWGVTFDQTTGVPPMEWFNALFKRSDEAVRYLLQRGIGEWSTTEDYPTGAHVQEGGKVWKAKAANVGKRPSINPTEWVETALTRDALKTLIQEQLGGGTLNFGQWLWSAATSGAPANGYLALNNSTPANATALLIAKSSNEGLDYSRGLSILRAGDTICFQSRDGGSVVQRFRVTGELVDSGTYRSVPVTHVGGAGGVPAANASLQVLLTPAGASDAAQPLFSVMWWPYRASVPVGWVPADGQALSRATYPDAWAGIVAAQVPTIAESAWQSTPTERGRYTSGDSVTTFRVPDYNGKAVGSLGAVFLRGDGALSAAVSGAIQADEIRSHDHVSGSYGGSYGAGSTAYGSVGMPAGADKVWANTKPTGGAETRPLNVTGCWVIKLAGSVTNAGSVDALALASAYASLVTRMESLEARPRPLGDGQTWQNLTASRVSGTTYTNTTGRPIFVQASISTGGITVICNGVSIIPNGFHAAFVVPNGGTYSIAWTNNLNAVWAELR
ncbi:hypothetical protein PHLH8_41880 [Pseudomonas sp. Pc102]|uniref:phage tail protein n=1 Tax=Pseudomonas sp. Pc102 TaxID=2678261 RepID=UPI001BCDAEA0|nr:phage tail protein [Pseudomonas sp. Pc102]BBP84546.1 hypothetical protein PHLH8_41880 [Pseudomonas sp. Pc102]